MDSTPIQYSVTQKIRSAHWESRKDNPSSALIQILPEGVRILLSDSQKSMELALDEIQFTSTLTEQQKVEQFSRFVPSGVLAESAVTSVTIAVEPRFFSFLSVELFSIEAAENCLRLLSDIPFEFTVFHEPVGNDTILFYAVPNDWMNWAKQIFSASEVYWTCGISGLIRQALSMTPSGEKAVYAHVDTRSFIGIGIENGKLIFANCYPFKAENDLLYFLLVIMDETGLQPELAPVYLSGSILSGSSGFEKINRYFGNLRFVKNPVLPNEFPSQETLQHPYYYDLTTLRQTLIPS